MLQQYNVKKICVVGAMIVCIVLLLIPEVSLAQILPTYNPLNNALTQGGLPGFPLKLLDDVEKVDFPDLTGDYDVGRAAYHLVDTSRTDIYTPCPPGQVCDLAVREFMIWVHYPANVSDDALPAPYVVDPLRSVLAAMLLEAGDEQGDSPTFDRIHSHAYMGVPVASDQEKYPVILFSHGMNMHPLFYTAMLEDLASQGYIVVSVVHPHDAMACVLFDYQNPSPPRVLMPPTGSENDLTSLVFSGDPEAPETIDAINQLILYEVDSRPGDLLFTLDRLENELNVSDLLLAGHLDLETVGAFGHSLGAVTAVWASQQNSNIKATIAMDPTTLPLPFSADSPPLAIDLTKPKLTQAFMFMNGAGAEYGSDLLPDIYWGLLQQYNCANVWYGLQPEVPPFYYFLLAGTTHQSYLSDLMLLYPFLDGFEPYGEGFPLIGFSPAEDAVKLLNAYITGFFNKHLRGDDIELPDNQLLTELGVKYLVGLDLVQFLEQPLSTPLALGCDIPGPGPGPGPSVVPEPGTITLMGLGLLGLLALARKMRRKAR